jgi:integrase
MARKGDGLYLRGKVWYLDCRIDGKRYVLKLGKNVNRTVAGELASMKRAAILKGEAGIGQKRKDAPFDQAAQEFLNWSDANKRPKTARHYRLCIGQLQKSFTGKRLSQIHPFAIEKHKIERKQAGAPVRANREVATLKRLFYWAKENRRFEGENPVCAVKFFEESPGRLRYLELEEDEQLLNVAQEPVRSMIVLGIHVGVRLQSEMLTLEWADVDLRRIQISILGAYTKNRNTRVVPLNKPAREVLARLKATAKGPYVFAKKDGAPYRSIRTVFEKACEAAGLKDVTPHTLRHTFASRLVMAGVDLRTVQELGGWSNLKMVQRYGHLSPGHKAAAVERLAEFHNAFHNEDRSASLATIG